MNISYYSVRHQIYHIKNMNNIIHNDQISGCTYCHGARIELLVEDGTCGTSCYRTACGTLSCCESDYSWLLFSKECRAVRKKSCTHSVGRRCWKPGSFFHFYFLVLFLSSRSEHSLKFHIFQPIPQNHRISECQDWKGPWKFI